MFDYIVQALTDYPYLGVALVFLLCGIGLPLPEEIVLLAAGYVCAKLPEHADLPTMMVWCACAILVGDMIPFLLGRIFGVRLLRLRWLRYFITKQRLATFDRWFRRRGDYVIVISRFLAGLRMVAFFTAGAMKMRWSRFLLLDGVGIVLLVPLLTWIGFRSANFIEEVIETVQTVERGLLWGSIGGALVLGLWFWWWRRRRQRRQRRELTETFVQPKKPIQGPPLSADGPLPGGEPQVPVSTSTDQDAELASGETPAAPADDQEPGPESAPAEPDDPDARTGESDGSVKP